jgi:hypothetical protein
MPNGRVSISAALVAACVAMAGCTPATTTTAPAKVEAPAKAETPARFVAGEGEPQTWTPLASDDPAIAAMAVVKFNDLPDLSKIASVRMYGMGSGDPAMNGLKVYLAFVSPHDERAFLLGDFRDYRVIAASPGRIDMEYDEDFMVGDQPQSRTLRTIVSWTETAQAASPNPEYPATVTMTPAQ